MLYKKIPFDVKREWRLSDGTIKTYRSMNINHLANIYALVGRLMKRDKRDYEKIGCAWEPPYWMSAARKGIENEINRRKRKQSRAKKTN